ncbi:MAG TPA: GxxExxY protein [Candidatus Sulfopaludibacter sp.]|nr:GxxExxY protein [Candidatus Sulfopaludibacter sp.]
MAASPRGIKARGLRWVSKDLIVADLVIVEIKPVEAVAPAYKKQLLTHLRLAGKRLGPLIDFNVAPIKEGITRIAHGMPD